MVLTPDDHELNALMRWLGEETRLPFGWINLQVSGQAWTKEYRPFEIG